MTLLLFSLKNAALAHLPTAHFVALRPTYSFQLAQYAHVFPLKPAPLYKLYAGLASTNMSATTLLFYFFLTLALSSPSSFLLPQSFWQIWQKLSFLLSCTTRIQWAPDSRFYRGTTQLISWTDGKRYSCPLQSLVISLSSYLSYPLFSFLGLKVYCLI